MTDQSITCPYCGKKISLTEALTHPIEEKLRKDFESENKRKECEHEAASEALKKEHSQALAGERAAIEKAAKKRAEDALVQELKDLKAERDEKAKLLDEARRQELALRKRQRELEERERTLALEVERKLDEERAKIREDALAKSAEEHHLRDREKDKQLDDMRKQIEECATCWRNIINWWILGRFSTTRGVNLNLLRGRMRGRSLRLMRPCS